MTLHTVSYFPEDGGIYNGYHDDIENTNPRDFLASMQRKGDLDIEELKTHAASNRFALPNVTYEYDEVSDRIADTGRAVHMRKASRRSLRRSTDYSHMRRMAELENSAALNDSAVEQLTIVQFVNQIIGRIQNVNVIARAFTNIPSNNLRGKIPEGGWPNVSVQVRRLQEPKIHHTDFGQGEYRIRRNDIHIYISREDRMEASVDPFAWATAQANQQMVQARDLLALKACSGLQTNSTYGTLADFTTTGTNVVPRATNDAVHEFLEVINGHFLEYRNQIKYVIMNNLDYRLYQSNYYVRNNIKVEPAKSWGVTPMLGLEEYGITAIISPWVPRGFAYALVGEGAYELDGPKIVDMEYDARKFADYTPMRDFIGYLIMNEKRFGEKLVLSGVTAGTEITTNAQIEQLLAPPDDVIEKNTSFVESD